MKSYQMKEIFLILQFLILKQIFDNQQIGNMRKLKINSVW